ncbi:MAG: hypothetical protein U0798_15730 [Gemmataceae bacterium]
MAASMKRGLSEEQRIHCILRVNAGLERRILERGRFATTLIWRGIQTIGSVVQTDNPIQMICKKTEKKTAASTNQSWRPGCEIERFRGSHFVDVE